MCMDYLNVSHNISILNTAFDSFHIDIMDGHFCKSIHLSPDYVKDIRKVTELPIVVHLMVEEPFDYIESLVSYGADTIIVHIESTQKNIFRIINYLHTSGKKVGVAICPSSPIECLTNVLGCVDLVSILSVDPGFIGQPLIPAVLDKIKKTSRIKEKNNYSFTIQSDGGVTSSTYSELIKAGTEDFVLGKAALFGKNQDLEKAIEEMRRDFSNAISK